MDALEELFEKKNLILNICFFAVFSLPFTLGGFFFTIVSGNSVAENGVIIFSFTLLLYDGLYFILYNLKRIPRWILKLTLINDRKKVNTPENLFFDIDYKFDFNGKILNINHYDKIKKEKFLQTVKNIIYKKAICRVAFTLTILTFVIPVVINLF